MTSDLLDAMRRATQAVRDGDPMDATRVIRDVLSARAGTPGTAATDDFDGITIDGTAAPESGSSSAEARQGRDRATPPPPPPTAVPMLSQSYRGPHGARDYRLFLPPQAPGGVRGLVLMLHGCTQNPDDFARGTAMNDIAAREGLIVVYPGQTSQHNANGCWNWFEPANQLRGAGEPAILAGLVQEVAKTHGVPAGSIFAAGLSAGGAMAALLGAAYPDVFEAVGVHSGLPAGSAQDVGSAFGAMNGTGAGGGFALDPNAPPSRTMIVHGGKDRTVVSANGSRIFEAMAGAFPGATRHRDPAPAPGMTLRRIIAQDGTVVAEHWDIPSLGHAWSGGDGAGTYTAPLLPEASEGFVRFFLEPKGGLRS